MFTKNTKNMEKIKIWNAAVSKDGLSITVSSLKLCNYVVCCAANEKTKKKWKKDITMKNNKKTKTKNKQLLKNVNSNCDILV